MHRSLTPCWITCSLIGLMSMLTQEVHSYPMDLKVFEETIHTAGDDPASESFRTFCMDTLQPYIIRNTTGPEFNLTYFPQNEFGVARVIQDTEVIKLEMDATIRAYFFEDNAGFNNSIGVDLYCHDYELYPNQQALIFANASTKDSLPNNHDTDGPYPAMAMGNYVDIGAVRKGTFLDFFLIADGANWPLHTFWNRTDANEDRMNHVRIVQFDNTPYYLMAWDDLPLDLTKHNYRSVFMVLEIRKFGGWLEEAEMTPM